jgi:hypothetical protein
MHVEVTPMGKLLGKVLRGLLKTSLYCIPVGLVIVVLFYGVQCTKSLASAVFGPSRQANPYAVVTQPTPHTVPAVPVSKRAPIANTISQPAVPAPLPIDNGGGTANVVGTPPTYNLVHVAHQPANPPYVIDAETEYVMFWYFGDIPRRFAKSHDQRKTTIPTTKPAPPSDRSDPPPASPPKIAAADPVTPVPSQQHASSFVSVPPVAVSPSGQSKVVPPDRQVTAQSTTPDVRHSQSSTNHTQNPSNVARGSQTDRSRGNPSNRGLTTQSPKGSPPSNPNQQGSSDNRKGRSNDSVKGR